MLTISDDETPEGEVPEYLKIVKDVIPPTLTKQEIEVLIKVYRWTKADKNAYFFSHICKRIDGYSVALKGLRQKGFIILVKSKDPYRITEDGVRVGHLLLELQLYNLL